MSLHAWISLAVTCGVFVGLQRRRAAADLLFLGGLVIVVAAGVIEPEEALAGFANAAVVILAALFVVAAALRSTGALDLVGRWVVGRAHDEKSALRRLAAPVVGLSAFLNNTPIVAMMVPLVLDWCRRHAVSPSRLLIPISYLAILGGTCTLIGTSTNLVVNGMLSAEYDRKDEYAGKENGPQFRRELRPMHLFEVGCVGLPCALMGAAYLLLIGHRRLPNRTELIEKLGEQRRQYLVEMVVSSGCPLIGKSVERAGLRHLPGLFLIEIDRNGEIIGPVTPEDVIRESDRLVFTGVVTTIADLERIPGLVPAADMTYEVNPRQRHRRHLTEAVLSGSSPLIGQTVREAKFRQLYNAAIVAVHRNGEQLTDQKIGDIRLEAGDTLLLQTRTEFVASFRHSSDFSLVAGVKETAALRYDRAWPALGLLAALVVLLTWLMLTDASPWAPFAAVGAAVIMVALRCLPIAEARKAIDIQVLLTIGAALGLGLALTKSHAAETMAGVLVAIVGDSNRFVALAAIYLLTLLFTEMITNTAVAALMFPLALEVAFQTGSSPRPFVMAVCIAASSSFLTPVGYQTNLMVLGPGGYTPRDYLRAGWPLVLLVMATALLLIPWFWPFAL